jgi:hypothetical protein
MKDGLVPEASQKGFSLEKTNSPLHYIIKSSGGKENVGGVVKRELVFKDAQGREIKLEFEVDEVYWEVKYFDKNLPGIQDKKGWEKLFNGTPQHTAVIGTLSDKWTDGRPRHGRWAFSATTKYKFEPGTYKFSTVSDDGVQVFVDDKLIINNWTHHGATTDTASIALNGVHTIKVHYCQDGGGSAFIINWSKSK